MKMNRPGRKNFTKEKLRRYLSDYLLVDDNHYLVKEIIAAKSLGLSVNLIGPSKDCLREIGKVLETLKIPYTPRIDTGLWNSHHRKTVIDSHETTGLSRDIFVPPSNAIDFGKQVAFYFQKDTHELGDRGSVEVSKIEIFFFYILKFLLSKRNNVPELADASLESVILDAVVDSQTAKYSDVGTISAKSIIPKYPLGNLLVGFIEAIQNLSPAAQLYGGFERDYKNWHDISFTEEAKNHPYNVRVQHEIMRREAMLTATISGKMSEFDGSSSTAPYLKRNLACRFDDIELVAQNVDYHWNTIYDGHHREQGIGDYPHVMHCLRMRLGGLAEDDIRRELQFADEDTYGRWLRENHIDLVSPEPCRIYERWKAARNALGISPESNVSAAQSNKVPTPSGKIFVRKDYSKIWNDVDEYHPIDFECSLLKKIHAAGEAGITVPEIFDSISSYPDYCYLNSETGKPKMSMVLRKDLPRGKWLRKVIVRRGNRYFFKVDDVTLM